LGSYKVALVSTELRVKIARKRPKEQRTICIYIMERRVFWVHLEAALSDGTEDLRQMKSRVLIAIISAIIQHLKYLHDLATATPFLQPLQHSFCIQFEISVFDGCVILSTRDQFVTFVYCHIVVLLTKVVYAQKP